MADFATVIGAVSATLAMVQVTHQCLKAFTEASHDAQSLLQEITGIEQLLNTVHHRLEDTARQPGANINFTHTSLLSTHLEVCRNRLQKLHKVLGPLTSKKSLRKAFGRLKWPLTKGDTLEQVEALHRLAQVFHFATTLDGL